MTQLVNGIRWMAGQALRALHAAQRNIEANRTAPCGTCGTPLNEHGMLCAKGG